MTLEKFLSDSYTPYQAVENAQAMLRSAGFSPLFENDAWKIEKGGKYYVSRGGSSLIAFTVGAFDAPFKIVASHADSPALKVKENPVMVSDGYQKLNVEPYGGGIWYSFFDRPLRIAGRIVKETETGAKSEPVVLPYLVEIPSLAVHMQRNVNDGFAVNPQVDLCPLLSLSENETFLDGVLSYDLFVVPAENPYRFGKHNEFLASPRIDNLTSVYTSLSALTSGKNQGVCVCAILNNEEVGSRTREGADGDFLETTLRRISLALQKTEDEFYRALSSSFMISLDNAHAVHPNHGEKCDPTNRPKTSGGIVLKSHANKAYVSDALSLGAIKKLFQKSEVKYQLFFNRSDMRSGGTLGALSLSHVSLLSVDMGIAQLAMHSACECFALSDADEMEKGLTAFYSSNLSVNSDEITLD